MTPFEFLKRIRGDAPIVCLAGADDRTPAIFGPDDASQFKDWLKANRHQNIYYQLNGDSPRRMLKHEIAGGRWLHVDIDHDEAGNHLANNSHAKAAVVARLRADGFTLIVDSGGGIQGLIELTEPAAREVIERANLGLIRKYAPRDQAGTWNMDRILRVAGTMNWPNEKKRQAGRVPVLAGVLFHEGPSRAIDDFDLAEPESTRESDLKDRSIGAVDVVEELPEVLPAPVARLITHFDDSGLKPVRDGSGSAKMFRALLLMLLHGMTPEEVKGVCLNDDWELGGYFFRDWADSHPGKSVEREIDRQIRQAAGDAKRYKLDRARLDFSRVPDEVDFSLLGEPDEVDFSLLGEDSL